MKNILCPGKRVIFIHYKRAFVDYSKSPKYIEEEMVGVVEKDNGETISILVEGHMKHFIRRELVRVDIEWYRNNIIDKLLDNECKEKNA